MSYHERIVSTIVIKHDPIALIADGAPSSAYEGAVWKITREIRAAALNTPDLVNVKYLHGIVVSVFSDRFDDDWVEVYAVRMSDIAEDLERYLLPVL